MLARNQAGATQMITTRCKRGTRHGAREKVAQCECGTRHSVKRSKHSWCEGQSTSTWRMLSWSKSPNTVNRVPPERKPQVYKLVWTQSYNPVRRKHWVYICICISCVSRECEYSLLLSLFHVHLENERVYSSLVSLENEYVYSFHVHLNTHWSLQVKTSGMFMNAGQRDARVELQM